ncbi:hypothetical protein QN372_18850 [Undibacterium sp. RTI2.1]|uniref:hypothetical protein n=1 Tax=unclassified Undibacterium TaxID=2630295 RepID=UPI002B2284D7|nr:MULTISPECIES: hypothetical protein [unclassified Undibacterium]MEB0032812.1 hypothetical protein [Undibacterium sp. RTI2.1]MEB0116466.1 hypothetical protein [Undibacterium sp. RTI2.2]
MADSLQTQLAANPRLRIGLAIVLGILGTYLVLDKAEQVDKKQKEYRRLSISLEQTRQQATDIAWVSRAKAASDALMEYRQRDWTDSSNGLIQSKWNDALQLILAQEKAVNSSVTMSDNLSDNNTLNKTEDGQFFIPGVIPIKAKLRFEVTPKSLYSVFQTLDSGKQGIIVDTFSYLWIGTSGRAELNLKALARVSRPADDKEKSASDDTGESAVSKTPARGA